MTEHLIKWNRLNKENAEQKFVSALYISITSNVGNVDKYSVWLLAGTGATAALLITQVKSILPYLSSFGFKACLLLLALSSILGFIAKYKAIRCEIQIQAQKKIEELMPKVFEEHGKSKKEILQQAEKYGLELETDINFSKVMEDFASPFSWWVKLLLKRKMTQIEGNPQASNHIVIKAYTSQLNFTLLQSLTFVGFIIGAAFFATAI